MLGGIGDDITLETCEQLFGIDDSSNIWTWLKNYIFMPIWIGIPILLIALTTIDFAKVVFVDDKEGIQNAFKRFGKRAVAAVLIFLTPTILIDDVALYIVNFEVFMVLL